MTTNTHRLCLANECKTRSTYGIYLTDLYCKIHSEGEIINYEELEDKNNTCEEIKPCGIYRCKDKAKYNFEDCKPLMCQKHSITNISLYKINKLKHYKTPRDCTRINCVPTDEIEKKAIVAFIKIKQENKEDKTNTGTLCLNCYNIIKDDWFSNNKSMIKQESETVFSKCLEKSCKNKRVFGTTSSNAPAICEYHYNMSNRIIFDVNNRNKVCLMENCKVRATFNLDGLKPEYCVIHKTEEMINTDAKRCEVDECTSQPTFGYEDDIATRCKEHILDDMIDVRSVLCEVEECKTQAHYGFDTKIRCGKHKSEGMEIVYKTQICNEENCKKVSCYGFENRKQEKCYTHRLENMINVKSRRCEIDDCNIIIGKKYKPYCIKCFIKLNPEAIITIEYKTKENAFVLPIKKKYTNCLIDKEISCLSKHRPDIFISLKTHNIIVEIDENQHSAIYYNKENEAKRLECFKLAWNKPLFIIRFNPDNYRVGKELFRSCFKYNRHTLRLEIVENEYKNRLARLLETIDKYYNISLDGLKKNHLEQIYLYYTE